MSPIVALPLVLLLLAPGEDEFRLWIPVGGD